MNRRNFFKTVTSFVAGVFAGSVKAKDRLKCGGQNGTLCPRCKFNKDRTSMPAEEFNGFAIRNTKPFPTEVAERRSKEMKL